jgi:hypothetical protein
MESKNSSAKTFCFVLNVNAMSFVSARDFLVSDDKFPTCLFGLELLKQRLLLLRLFPEPQ